MESGYTPPTGYPQQGPFSQTPPSPYASQATTQIYRDPNQLFADNENLRARIASLEQQLEREKKRGAQGVITTASSGVRWGDADTNNPVQLRGEIEKLENRLKRFLDMKNNSQGAPIQFNEDHANQIRKLFEKYRLSRSFDRTTVPSLDLTAALQRSFIEYILDETKNWTNNMGKRKKSHRSNDNLEADIINATNNLIILLHEFAGDDELSISNVTTVRQNISASLRARAFGKENHAFINQVAAEIVTRLGWYRPIAIGEAAGLNVEAANIVKRVIKILNFGLRAQERVPKILFYDAGYQLDASVMTGSTDFSEETISSEEVSICGFPLIAGDPNSPYDKSVLYKAAVRTQRKLHANAPQPQLAQQVYASPPPPQAAPYASISPPYHS